MSIETGLRTLLLTDAAVAALITARVYPISLPQEPTLPAVVYNRIDGAPAQFLSGSGSLKHARYQLDCYSTVSYSQAKAVAAAVNEALDGYRGSYSGGTIKGITVLDDGTDLSEPELEEFRVKLEYSVWYTEA